MAWGRADNARAGKWEVECRTAWAERDSLKQAVKERDHVLAQRDAQLAATEERFAKLAAVAIVAASDADAVRLAGGDGPAIGNGLLAPDFGSDSDDRGAVDSRPRVPGR